jgi:CHAT domain-containing protein
MSTRSQQWRFSLLQLIVFILFAMVGIPFALQNPTLQARAQGQTAQTSTAQTLRNQGLEQAKNRQFAAAAQSLKQSLELFQQAKDMKAIDAVLADLDRVYSQMGDIKGVIEWRKQRVELARNVKDRYTELLISRELGHTYYCLNDFNHAIAAYQKTSQLVGEKKWEAFSDWGHALLKAGKFGEAEKQLRWALADTEVETDKTPQLSSVFDAQLEDDNNQRTAQEQYEISKSLQQALVAQNKPDLALEIAERGRNTALSKLLLSQTPTAQRNLPPPTIEQLKQIARSQKATLVEYSVIYDRFRHECITDKQKLRQALHAHQQAVKLLIWVIQPTGDVTFRQVDLAPLLQKQDTPFSEFVSTMRSTLRSNTRQTSLKQFNQALIQPIREFLPRDEQARVIFIPDEVLFYVPFPALLDTEGRYLIEKHTILTAPSIQILDLTRRIRTQKTFGRGALVVGNPSPMPMDLAELPGSEKEAIAIAKLLNTKPLIGSQATKETILRQMLQVRIIHLATHGILNELDGGKSALAVVAPEDARHLSFPALLQKTGVKVQLNFPNGQLWLPDNGLISAREILSLSVWGIPAELAVLSACDTGLGDITGDGIVGLSRSLIAAGIPSIVVSLWSVPDAATEHLMSQFYRQLQQTPNKATALRNAILSTKREFPTPRDWAGFTLIGESE